MLRQRSRPYLFSNSTLAPAIVGASIKVFENAGKTNTSLRESISKKNQQKYFKKGDEKSGFCIVEGDSAIVLSVLYKCKFQQQMAEL